MTKVGVLGLGLMGAAAAGKLLSNEHEVHVWNRTESKARELVDRGAIAHSTPYDLARAVDIAITLVTDDHAVDDLAMGEKGLLQGMKRGSLWVDMSTIDPDESKRHAEECHRRGIERLDAPVVGGPKWIAEGRVMLLVGGRREVFEKHLAFLNQFASSALYMGEDSNGHKMKLLMNLYLALVSVSFLEAFTLSRKMGLEPAAFLDTVNRSVHKNYFSEVRAPPVLRREFSPAFTLKNLLKDLLLVDNQMRRHGAVLPTSTVVTQLFRTAANMGDAGLDYTSIILALEKLNGMQS